MLKRIKINGYKSLNNLEVSLQPLSVFFGPNAAGKSNLLDALQLLSAIVTSRTLKEAFEPPYRGKPLESFTFDQDGMKGLLKKETVSFSIEADIELSDTVIDSANQQVREMKRKVSDGASEEEKSEENRKEQSYVHEKSLRYRIEVEITPKTGILRVADEYLAGLNKEGQVTRRRKPFLEKVKGRLHLRMEGQAHPTYYECYLDHSILSMPHYPPHYPHLIAARQELASWLFFYFEPRERMRAANPVKEVRHIGLMGEELASFLNTLRAFHPQQFRAVEKAMHMVIPNVTGIEVDVNEHGTVDLRLIEGETPVPVGLISEGTLRVLGLLALAGAKETSSLIGFEEPENGIHPQRIRMIADILKNRALSDGTQLIVTTHSPILPDMVKNDSLFVCRKEGKRTVIESFSTWGALGRKTDIGKALDRDEETLISERMMRGDFDA